MNGTLARLGRHVSLMDQLVSRLFCQGRYVQGVAELRGELLSPCIAHGGQWQAVGEGCMRPKCDRTVGGWHANGWLARHDPWLFWGEGLEAPDQQRLSIAGSLACNASTACVPVKT